MTIMRRWAVAGFLVPLWLSGPALAQDDNACGRLLEMFDAGSSAEDVVRAAVEEGRTLSEAAVFTLVCGGEAHRVDVAVASVAMSGNMAQAEAVAQSLVRTAGEGSPVAAAAYSTLRGLIENLPQPSIHQDSYTPHGGSVSPST